MKIMLSICFAATLIAASIAEAAYEVVKVKNGGIIEGVVTFEGTPPKPKKVLITKDNDVCGKGMRLMREVSVSENGGLRNAVVFIASIESGKDWDEPADGYMMDQIDCRFVPSIMIVPRGSKLKIKNSDPVLHNIHAYELIGRARRGLFNIAQPIQNAVATKKIRTRRSKFVKVECDVHNFMEAWMLAAENPYYAKVDDDGKFTIDQVPAGKYKLTAWHPVLGPREADVKVSSGKSGEVKFVFESNKK